MLWNTISFNEGGEVEMFASAAADKTCGRQSFSFYPNLAWSILDLLSVLCIRDSFAADKRNTTYDDMFLSSRKSSFDVLLRDGMWSSLWSHPLDLWFCFLCFVCKTKHMQDGRKEFNLIAGQMPFSLLNRQWCYLEMKGDT